MKRVTSGRGADLPPRRQGPAARPEDLIEGSQAINEAKDQLALPAGRPSGRPFAELLDPVGLSLATLNAAALAFAQARPFGAALGLSTEQQKDKLARFHALAGACQECGDLRVGARVARKLAGAARALLRRIVQAEILRLSRDGSIDPAVRDGMVHDLRAALALRHQGQAAAQDHAERLEQVEGEAEVRLQDLKEARELLWVLSELRPDRPMRWETLLRASQTLSRAQHQGAPPPPAEVSVDDERQNGPR